MKKIIPLLLIVLFVCGVGCIEERLHFTADSFSHKDWHIICLNEKDCVRIPNQTKKIKELENKIDMLIEAEEYILEHCLFNN